MMAVFKYTGIMLLLTLTAVGSLTIYALSDMKPSTLVMCSNDEGGIYIPARVCEFYLTNIVSEDDILEDLSIGGIGPLLAMENDHKYALISYLITLGLNIDGVNHHNFGEIMDVTPLHASVLTGSFKDVDFLLNQSANTALVSHSLFSLTPLELARKLYAKNQNKKWFKIISLLERSSLVI